MVGIEPTTFGILARMLCQLSYAFRSVRVCNISELSLVPSILLDYIDIEGTGLSSEISHTRPRSLQLAEHCRG